MDGYRGDTDETQQSARWLAAVGLLCIVPVLVIGTALEDHAGVSLSTTLRVVDASICLLFIYRLSKDFPEEKWPRIGLWTSLIVNIGIFFTPLVDRPISRGEVMVFAVPDAIVVLVAMLVERIVAYPAVDVHQRAVRQQIILGLVLALAFCAVLLTLVLLDPRSTHSTIR